MARSEQSNALLYLSLGSNLGDRQKHLQTCLDGLARFLEVTKVSSLYDTLPWGPIEDQPSFLNACLEAESALAPAQILLAIKELEIALGRDVQARWGPHEVDIDLLFYDGLVEQIGTQSIPHRHIRRRGFVLRPLADIAPDLLHPQYNLTVAEMLAEIEKSGVQPYPGELLFRQKVSR